MPFKLKATTRDERFGVYTQAERIKIPATKLPAEWRGFIQTSHAVKDDRLTLWDATMMQMLQFSPKTNTIIQESTAPNDLIKPPSDRMGEPTKKEISKARATFKTNYRKVFGPRYSGLVPLPSEWSPTKGRDKFAVATKIPNYPVALLSCDSTDSMACNIDRFCYLEGGPTLSPTSVVGVGILSKGNAKYLVIGDSEKKSLHIFNWKSCFNIQFVKTIGVPELHGKITSVYSDFDQNLWITTDRLNSFLDSNLFYWESERVLEFVKN
jgi:hypothetical protein